MMKGQRRPGNGFDLSEAPSHLIRRCQQFYGDLYAREAGGKELTKQQYILLCALEQNDGVSQTALVEITGIDRSTLAEMVRRMLEKGLLSRERTEEDQRANAVAISPSTSVSSCSWSYVAATAWLARRACAAIVAAVMVHQLGRGMSGEVSHR